MRVLRGEDRRKVVSPPLLLIILMSSVCDEAVAVILPIISLPSKTSSALIS